MIQQSTVTIMEDANLEVGVGNVIEFAKVVQHILEHEEIRLNIPIYLEPLLHRGKFQFVQMIKDEKMKALYEFVSYIHGMKDKVETVHFEYKHPENWKEYFKERWFPKWLLKKFPVKFVIISKTKKIQKYKVCPHLRDDGQGHVLFDPYKTPDKDCIEYITR